MTRAVLERKSRAELLQLAKRAGLRGISLLKKAALVEALLRTAAAPPLRRHAKKKRAGSRPVNAQQRQSPVKPKRQPASKEQPSRSPQVEPAAKPQPKSRRSAPFQKKSTSTPPAKSAAPAKSAPPAAKKSAPAPAKPAPVPASQPIPAPATTPVLSPRKMPPVTELPAEYGKTGLVLLEVDPRHLHVYWEVTVADREAALRQLGEQAADSRWVLRFYDTTFLHFDGHNAHSFFDVPIELSAGNWYMELWSGEKTYCAEIGPRSSAGQFVAVCRSNFVHIPRGEQSPEYRPEWTKVSLPAGPQPQPLPPVQESRSAVAAPETPLVASSAGSPAVAAAVEPEVASPPTTEEPKEITEAKVRRHYEDMAAAAVEVPSHPPAAAAAEQAGPASGEKLWTTAPSAAGTVPEIGPLPGSQPTAAGGVPSSAASSSFGLGSGGGAFPATPPSIDLHLNAEVVVSGRAQPGQSVQMNGHWIKVNADGTFSVRLALPVVRD